MRNKLHEEGFAQVLADLSTEEGVAGLSEQGIALNDAMRNAASYLAVIFRGMAPNYPDSPSLSWLERKIENAAKGEDDALLDALFTPVRLRGRPSLPREERQRIAGYVAVQYEIFYRSLTTGDYNEDSAFVATAKRFKQSVSTVRRCVKEFFPNGIAEGISQEVTQDQIDAFQWAFRQVKFEDEKSFLLAYRWHVKWMSNQQREAAIEYSKSRYGQDLFTPFAEAEDDFGFDENDANRALAWMRHQIAEEYPQLVKMRELIGPTDVHSYSIFSFPPMSEKQLIISDIIDHVISCSNFQIDLNISEENYAP